MRIPSIVSLAIVLSASPLFAAFTEPAAVIPVAGSTPGAQGAEFHTELQLSNPGETVMRGKFVFIDQGIAVQPNPPTELAYELQPHETRFFEDVVESMGASGLGSIDVFVTAGGLPTIIVRAFDDQGEDGTTGLTVPVVPLEEAFGEGETVALIAPSSFVRFRFNIGVRTVGTEAVRLRAHLFANNGEVLGDPVDLDYPGQFFAQNAVTSLLPGREFPAGSTIVFEVLTGRVILYATTVDNRTNDGSIQLAAIFSAPPPRGPLHLDAFSGTPVTIALGPALDPDGNPYVYSLHQAPLHGTLGQVSIVGGQVQIVYTPDRGYTGADRFVVTIASMSGRSSRLPVLIDVETGDAAPVALDSAVTTEEDTPVQVALSASNPNGDPLSWMIVTEPGSGTLSGIAPSLFYTPFPDFNGSDSFTFKVNDGTEDSNLATVTIEVTSVNDDPTAVNDTATLHEDSTGNVIEVLANDSSDPDFGETLTILDVTQPANGMVAINGTDVSYTPNADFFGTDPFSYTISDGNGGSATATVTVTVSEVNDVPVATGHTATTSEDTPVVIAAATLTANDRPGPANEAAQTLTVTAVVSPATSGGTVSLSGGNVTYTPPVDYIGTDTFTYTVTDDGTTNGAADPLSASGTVTVTVVCPAITVNDPANASGTAGTPFSETFTQTGDAAGAPPVFTSASTLPAGLTLAPSGELSGTATETGTFRIVVIATNGNGCSGTSASYDLVIGCPVITVTIPANAGGTAGSAFSETFTQTGAIGTAAFTTSSTLPDGLTFSTAGILSGTPTRTGAFPIEVMVADDNGCTGTSATYNLVIGCPTITVTNAANTDGTAGSAFSETFTQTGAIGTAAFTTTSTMPRGLTLSSSGVLSGTPTQTGTFPIVMTVTDDNGCPGTGVTYNLVIACQTITVNTPANAAGTAGSPFSETFMQTAAIGTASFSTSNTLPAGLTLAANGVLSGTPTETGTFPIVVTATDDNGCTGTGATYDLVVGCPTIPVASPANTNGTAGVAFSETFTQTSAIGTAVFTSISTLPDGLTLATSGVLSGTPTQTGTFPIEVTVTDDNGCTGTSATYNLVVGCPTITVTVPANTSGTVSSAFSETFTQTGAVGSATFTTASTLPNGVTLSTSGVLSGTPTQTGTFPIVVTVTDGNGCTGTSATYNLVIACQMITVTNPANATGPTGSAFSETFTETGAIGSATFTTASTLPTGLTLSTVGVLSGTPAQAGTFPIVVTVTDANGCTGSGPTYDLVITCPAITVTNPANGHGTANSAFSEAFTSSGGIGTMTHTLESGTLPAGLTLAANGVLSGRPTQTGSFPVTVTATDSNGCTGAGSTYTIVIACQTITVTNPANANGNASAPFSENFTQTGGIGATIFTLDSGTLPAGLTLAANGMLSGNPTETGAFPIVVTVTDDNGCIATGGTYTIFIACQTITITNPANASGTVNAALSETFAQTGAIGTALFTTSSMLPDGLTLATSGVLSGTPTQTGTFPIEVTVTDDNGCTGTSATHNLVVGCQAFTVTSPANASGTGGSAFSETFTQTGAVGSATFTTASTLPNGVTLSTSGVLSGTPTQTGTFPIVVTVTDGNGCTGTSATYNLVIACQTITVTNPANATGPTGSAFSETFTETGALGSATFTTASTLPAGLTLSTAGVLSGTPAQAGTFPIVVTVTDANGCTGSGPTYDLVITCPAITVTNPANGHGTANSAFSEAFTSSGGIGTMTHTLESGTLPAGLTLAANGVLSGRPTQTGSFPVTVTATDSNGCTGAGSTYTIVIACQTITVTNPANASGDASAAFSETFTQTGGIGATTFTLASGTLPAGLTLGANGVLSGTPTQTGSFPITVTMTDDNGCTGTSATYNLTIACQTINVTNPANASGTVNAAFSETFTQTGALGSAPFITAASTLPAGLTLASSGVLSGTPTEPGTFPIVVTVIDANGCTGSSATYNLVIACQTITVTKPANANGTAAASFSETFTQSGSLGGATFTTPSTLPAGITLSAAGILSGMPTQTGSFPIVVTVTDGNGCTGTSATYNLVIACPTITVTNPANASGTVDAAFSATFTQTGAISTATFTTSSTLPAGLTLSAGGVLSGTAGNAGSFPIVVTVTDDNGCTGASATYNLVIACQTITVTNPAVTTGTVEGAFNQTFTQTGVGTHTPATFTTTDPLPSGLTLSTAGVLSGTPGEPGTFPVTVTVTDVNGCSGRGGTYNLVIACQTITVTNPGVSTATYGQAFSQTFTQSGVGTPAIWMLATGTLPAGLTLSSAGVLSGAPMQTGTFPITVTVMDAYGCSGTGGTYTLSVAPVAVNDTFNGGVDNTRFVLTGGVTGTPATPSVQLAGTIEANDLPSAATVTVGSGTFATAGGGSVTIAADGTFLYTPPVSSGVGAMTTDSFTYSVTSNTGGVAPVTSAPATVTINLAGRVWYVKNDAAGGGSGQSHSPFNTLTAAQTASTANDHVFVYFGDGNTTGQNSGFVMKSGQTLHGQGLSLVVNSATLVAAGSQPLIGNSGGDGVTIGNMVNTTIRGLSIAGNANAIDMTTSAAATGTTTITNNTIRSAGAEGIDVNLNAGTTGTQTLAITNNVWNTAGTHSGTAIDVNRAAGTLRADVSGNSNVISMGGGIIINGGAAANTIITRFAGNAIHGDTGGAGVNISNVTFDGDPDTAGFQQCPGGTLMIGVSGNFVGGSGLQMTTVSGSLGFTDLDIYAGNGPGIFLSSTGQFTGSSGMHLVVLNGSGSIVHATNGAAVAVSDATLNMVLSNITTSGGSNGVSLVNAGGLLAMQSGSSIASTGGTAFQVSGLNANVTYHGTITNTAGKAVVVSNTNGGTKAFTGAIIDTGTGIDLLTNPGTTINFSGGISLTTGANPGFTATSGGTVNVTGTNTITTTTGTALRVENTTIGGSGLTFRSISANGAANGIVLNNTGSAGGLAVTGNGGTCTIATPTCTGGTIQNTTGPGILLTSTSGIDLTRIRVHDANDHGIRGTTVTGFHLRDSVVTLNGDALNEHGLDFSDLFGTGTISNSAISQSFNNNVMIRNSAGTLSLLTVTGSTFSNNVSTSDGDGLLFEASGTANMAINVSGSTFSAHHSDHFQAAALNSGVLNVVFSNNTLSGGHAAPLGQGITINAATAAPGFGGSITYDLNGNTINGAISHAINVTLGTSSAAASFRGQIRNNVIGTSGQALSCSTQANGMSIGAHGNGTHTVSVTGNALRRCFDRGIHVIANDGNGALNVTATNNTVTEMSDTFGTPREAFLLVAGAADPNIFGQADSHAVCLSLSASSLVGGAYKNGDIRVRQRFRTSVRLPGYFATAFDTPAVVNFLQSNNPGSTATATANDDPAVTTDGYFGGAACPLP